MQTDRDKAVFQKSGMTWGIVNRHGLRSSGHSHISPNETAGLLIKEMGKDGRYTEFRYYPYDGQ